MMLILEILGILLLIGGIFVAVALQAAFITGLIWMFFTGLQIVMAPVKSCPDGCFITIFDSKSFGWVLVSLPVMLLIFFISVKLANARTSR